MAEPRTPDDGEYLSPYSVKELFIEYCIREWEEPNFSESISKNNLEAMSMLDSGALEDLEPGAPLYSGPDLFSALHREVSSVGREAWLRQRIASSLQDVQLRNQVGVRLDEDLNAVGMSHMTGIRTSMKEKARALAKYRLKRNISSVKRTDPPKPFKVTLKTLIGGFAGLPQKTNLYFDYSTSFDLFLVMLRDVTQRSTIPPIDFDERSPVKRESSTETALDTASQVSASGSQHSFNGKESGQGSPNSRSRSPSERPSSRSGLNPQYQARNSNDRGYTLADGPWLYRFKCEPPKEEGTAYGEVKDDLSYRKMVDNIKEIVRKDPGNNWTISLVHSMDQRALNKWEKKQDENKKSEELFSDEFSESGEQW